jgi:Tubulin like
MRLRENQIAPAFFIGLGGCGGAIVDELARKVKQEPSFDRYKDLIHFFALDTDTDDLARHSWIDSSHKFTLSDFDKPDYVDLKQGKLHAKPDELFTQWWPDWYRPRSTRGKGAGQIRIESRLAFYHHLENDGAKILETLEKAIRRAYDVHNPFRAQKAAKIYIYASLAGGTGSGGFAMMAYTMRRLLGGQRGHQLIGTFVLPNVFKSKGLPPNQFDKIMANGYSALQELELLQGAKPEVLVEFHYDPDHPERKMVDRPPFDQIYLIEEKTALGVVISDSSAIYPAIADAAHAQIFSSIIDKEGSALDNDTRELMQLDEQAFTKSFGSFGISALILPTDDILAYAATRLGAELLLSAVPGGTAAIGDGADLESADQAFVRGFEAKAEQKVDDAETFRRAVEWVKGGGAHGGEGAIGAFIRRCKEDVSRQVDGAIKLRAWEDSELATFEKDPERVQSETASAWSACSAQLVKSEDAAREQARRAAAEVASGTGPLSLSAITKDKGPSDTRYLNALLRQTLLAEQEEARKAYDRGLSFADPRLQDDFRRKTEELKAAAPETLLEKLPGRENDYIEVASGFAAWYRDALAALRARVRANAMLEFFSAVVKEIDRRRTSTFQFFAQVDRVARALQSEAQRLLVEGSERGAGGEANRFVLDVEVLQDHTTGKRLWEHLYHRIVRPSDFQLSGALSRLAEVARAGSGGSEQDIQRKVTAELKEMAASALRTRINGDRDSNGLRLDEELVFEAKIVLAGKRLAREAHKALPPPNDPTWTEETARVTEEQIAGYVKDKLDHAASKCQPFITPSVGAPLLPDKSYAVVHRDYLPALADSLATLSSHRIDKGQMIIGEDPHALVFYDAQLGIPLHALKSLVDYERRYFAVKQKELAEASKVPGLSKGVPQIPLHQDKTWEGAPDVETRLFRISIEGVKENESKIAWTDRLRKLRESHGEATAEGGDLRDFTLGLAFGQIEHLREGAGAGYHLTDADLPEADRRLGKFRDQAFKAYRARNEMQKTWLRRGYAARLATFEEDRDVQGLKAKFDAHVTELERLIKVEGGSSKVVGAHLAEELAAVEAFRRERGI